MKNSLEKSIPFYIFSSINAYIEKVIQSTHYEIAERIISYFITSYKINRDEIVGKNTSVGRKEKGSIKYKERLFFPSPS